MVEHSSININVGRDMSGVFNLGTISGNVSNTINKLPESPDPNQPGLKEILLQIQAAIESEPELSDEDKAEALEQVKVLAEAGQNPNDTALQKAGKTAMKILKGTTAGLVETTKLAVEFGTLLPALTPLLLFL